MSSIKKIVLEVGGVELSLSMEDAKTLHAALNDLFPAKAKKEIQFIPQPYPVYPTYPRPYWYEYRGGVRLTTTAGNTGNAISGLNLSGSSFKSTDSQGEKSAQISFLQTLLSQPRDTDCRPSISSQREKVWNGKLGEFQ